MHFSSTDEVLISLPGICELSQADLAHDLM